jgi:hypothetical protein
MLVWPAPAARAAFWADAARDEAATLRRHIAALEALLKRITDSAFGEGEHAR